VINLKNSVALCLDHFTSSKRCYRASLLKCVCLAPVPITGGDSAQGIKIDYS